MSAAIDIHALCAGRRWSLPRVLLDVALWAGLAATATAIGHPAAIVLAAVAIGAGPLNDILLHGHEATHRLAARQRWLNGLLAWACNGLFLISATAYRCFHLEHHRRAMTADDPEAVVLRRCGGVHVPGWCYVAAPLALVIGINLWPFARRRSWVARLCVLAELLAALGLHGALAWVLGPALYGAAVALPIAVGVLPAAVLRSVCEHHGLPAGDTWTQTRSLHCPWWQRFLWSNHQYHLEHHLHPGVPFHRLGALHQALADEYARRGVVPDRGVVRTGLRLLRIDRRVREAA